MRTTRRTIITAAGISALGLAGCSTAQPTTTSTGSAAAGKVAVPLWYWGGGLSDAVVKETVTKFAETLTISAVKVEGDFKQKLTTTLTGGQGLPGVTGLKGEDIAVYRSVADKFVDLNTLGAADHKKDFVEWKWAEATTPDGKQIGMPIDIGPTALFYRQDIFGQAGLPTEPAAVGTALKTWDDFFAFAKTLRDKTSTYMVSTVADVFPIFIGQGPNRFVGQNNDFLGESPAIKEAWERCIKLLSEGLVAKTGKSYQTALTQGKLSADLGAAWHALDIKDNAPDLKGKFRVTTHPGEPTNFGGSFLGIPAGFPNPKQAFDVLLWLLTPENGARGFADAAIFPASPASYSMQQMTEGDAYFGGQKTIDVFGTIANKVVKQFTSAADSALSEPYYTELGNVETGGKDATQAWTDAVAAAKQVASRQGVK